MRSISDIREMIKSIAMVYPILPIEMVSPEPVCIYPVKGVNLYKNYTEVDRWGHCIERIGVGEAIRVEYLGEPIERYESIYEAESEDFYAGVIEHLGMPCTMSYFDAINSSNVY
jgi:hypothetical protein